MHDIDARTFAPVVALALTAALTGDAHAQLTSVAPFAGEFVETFDDVPITTAATRIFDDFEIRVGPSSVAGELAFVSQWQVNGCFYLVPQNEKFVAMLTDDGLFGSRSLEFRFHEPVQRFGAHFAEALAFSGPTLTAYDESGATVGTLPMAIPNTCLNPNWFGVESAGAGISRIVIERDATDGGLIIDDVRGDVRELGVNYCGPAVPNSSGQPGAMSLDGSAFASVNELALVATQLPTNTFGFFIASRTQGFAANPGGSQGNLCLGGSIGRFVDPLQLQNSGASGSFVLGLDLTFLPTPTGPVSAVPGETWNFQAWFRDANPASTSNFTDGVALTLR